MDDVQAARRLAATLKPGDEHPTRKGWYLTDMERDGVPQWYRPPSPVWRKIHLAVLIFWGSLIAFGFVMAALFER